MELYTLLPFVQPALIALLLITLVSAFAKIQELKAALLEEKNKRLLPVLLFEVDTDAAEITLLNDSQNAAKDIRIENMHLDLKYEHRKTVKIEFEPIELLNPQKKAAIKFQVFDNGFQMRNILPHTLIGHFLAASFEMVIHFQNMENTVFREVLIKEDQKIYIREVTPQIPPEEDPANMHPLKAVLKSFYL